MKTFILLTVLLGTIHVSAPAQNSSTKIKTIEFTDEKFRFSPKDFHISSVIDDRDDISNIGFAKVGLSDRKATLQLYDGAAASIQDLLDYNMRQNTNTTPIELHITALNVSEKRSNGTDKATIKLGFAFYINGQKRIELASDATVESGIDVTTHIEGVIRKQTETAMSQFADWFAKNKAEILAAPSIKVEVTVNNDPKSREYIPYSFDRALTYNDFKGQPGKPSIAAAATATTVSLDATSVIRGQHVTLQISIGALFNKEMSWFKKYAMHQRVLAHEQMHFDITAYMACELIHTIQNYQFTPGNFEEELQQIKKQSERDTQKLQDQYDEETNHGLIEDKQREWSNKVIEMLLLQDCFK